MPFSGSKDNNLSTLFLLIIIGVIIYLLTRNKDNYYNEPINSIKVDQSNVKKLIAPPLDSTGKLTGPLGQQLNEAQLEQAMVKTQNNSNQLNKVQFPVSKDINDSIFNFAPNDDNILTGAELGNAFQNPIQNIPTKDTVNLNQNNVKNYNAKDFLPQEVNDSWFDTDFSQAKYLVDDSLINTNRYVIGINTVGQSLKNASYDIRGTVPNPKFSISPWNNSTYEPDYNIKPLC